MERNAKKAHPMYALMGDARFVVNNCNEYPLDLVIGACLRNLNCSACILQGPGPIAGFFVQPVALKF